MLYHHYAELLAFVAGCLLIRHGWPAPFKWLVFLGGLTFLVEIAGHIMWTKYQLYNNWLYNLFLPIQCSFFLLFFYATSYHRKVKKVIVGLMIIMLVGIVISYSYHQSFYMLNSYASTLYLLLMLIASCLFYVDAIINDLEISMIKQPAFWVAVGLLFFTVVFILLFALWAVNIKIPHYKVVLKYSIIAANTFLYGGLIVSFICLNKIKSYYLRFS